MTAPSSFMTGLSYSFLFFFPLRLINIQFRTGCSFTEKSSEESLDTFIAYSYPQKDLQGIRFHILHENTPCMAALPSWAANRQSKHKLVRVCMWLTWDLSTLAVASECTLYYSVTAVASVCVSAWQLLHTRISTRSLSYQCVSASQPPRQLMFRHGYCRISYPYFNGATVLYCCISSCFNEAIVRSVRVPIWHIHIQTHTRCYHRMCLRL